LVIGIYTLINPIFDTNPPLLQSLRVCWIVWHNLLLLGLLRPKISDISGYILLLLHPSRRRLFETVPLCSYCS